MSRTSIPPEARLRYSTRAVLLLVNALSGSLVGAAAPVMVPAAPVMVPAAPHAELQGRDGDQAWAQDLDYLVKELPKRHPDLFAKITKKSFKEEADMLRSELGRLSVSQRLVRMMELVALAGDSHTTLSHPTQAPYSTLPLELRAFEDGMYVVGVAKSRDFLIGSRLVNIGGVPWDEASARLRRLRAAETPGWRDSMLCQTVVAWELLQGLGLAGAEPQVTLAFQDATGAQKEVMFEAMLNGVNAKLAYSMGVTKVPDYALKRNGLRNWVSMLSRKPVLYARYNRCSDEPSQSVESFCEKVIEAIEGSTPQRVVLDLRGNTGGSSALLSRLIRFLERRDDLKGKVYVAINGSTFSSGLINAYELKKAGGILIGEPSGSPLNHFGDVRSFTLPNTKLQVFHSSRRFLLDRSYQDGEALRVDVSIHETASDWFAGRDAVLEHVITTLP